MIELLKKCKVMNRDCNISFLKHSWYVKDIEDEWKSFLEIKLRSEEAQLRRDKLTAIEQRLLTQ